MSGRASRSIDHLVLPVTDLVSARTRLTGLGFAVERDAAHPFGTANACVFLADGTYLEPLAVADQAVALAAAGSGNSFVARDQAFRQRCGDDGFSAVVFKTANTEADDVAYRAEAISGGAMVSFSRPVSGADGSVREAAFHLAFAADALAPDVFFFSCERVNAAAFPAAPAHANGVTGLRSVVLCAADPSGFAGFLEKVVQTDRMPLDHHGVRFEAANGRIDILTPDRVTDQFGVSLSAIGTGLRAVGLVFATGSLDQVEQCLQRSDIPAHRNNARVVVPAARGQGAFMVFEDEASAGD